MTEMDQVHADRRRKDNSREHGARGHLRPARRRHQDLDSWRSNRHRCESRCLSKSMRQSRIRWWTPLRPRSERSAGDANTCAAPVRARRGRNSQTALLFLRPLRSGAGVARLPYRVSQPRNSCGCQSRIAGACPAQFFERRAAYAWFVVGTVCIGAFIGQVDASIVQLAMPSFEDAFDAPLDAVSWVAVAYVLAFAAVLPAFARLAEIGGRKTLLSLRLRAVRSVLGPVRPRSEPAAAGRVPGAAGDRRLDAGREQRRYPGRRGRSGAAGKSARNHGGGAGGRSQPRPCARRRAAGDAGLALDLLGHRSVRSRGRGPRLADRPEDDVLRQGSPLRRLSALRS